MQGRVLIVDDEVEILRSLSRYLRLEGFEVDTCEDPRDALQRVRTEHYPVLLCDIMMPGMSGIDLLQEVLKVRPLTNVIMMTAYTSMDKVVACLGQGARDYLVKPFDDLESVGSRVREAAERVGRWRDAIALH